MKNEMTKLRCVNTTNTDLRNTSYFGRMLRTRNKRLSPTSVYKGATYFEMENPITGKLSRYHILRFMPV